MTTKEKADMLDYMQGVAKAVGLDSLTDAIARAKRTLLPLSQVVVWIPVAERLPEKGGEHLVAMGLEIVSWLTYQPPAGQGRHGVWVDDLGYWRDVTHCAEPLRHPSELGETP